MKAFFKNPVHIAMLILSLIVLFAATQAVKQIKNGHYHSVNW